ncbi:MAG: hypothetical protein IRY85_09995 [Micromonosporaceae bacterium]|nr:hypothetical protein [Micromonosporaceae bacterium]
MVGHAVPDLLGRAAAVVTYMIEIRNRRLRGDRWMRWGVADGDAESLRCLRALRAAFGERYEIRRRAVGGAR